MKDKLGRLVNKDDKVAVASLKFDGNLNTHPCLNIGTVIFVNTIVVTVKFDSGFTDDIEHNEFIILPKQFIDLGYEASTNISSFVSSLGVAVA